MPQRVSSRHSGIAASSSSCIEFWCVPVEPLFSQQFSINTPTLAPALYVAANNQLSEQAAKAGMLKHHLLPAFGELRCDEIRMHAIESIKAAKLASSSSRKRVNNILACLGKILRYAHETEVLASVPKIKLLKLPPQKFDFHTFEELERLLQAVKDNRERRALFLLVAEAGLRQGEMIALEWGDIDFVAGKITVRRSEWRGIVGSPKEGVTEPFQ